MKNKVLFILNEIKEELRSKSYGFYVSLVPFVLLIASLIAYNFVPQEIYNPLTFLFIVIGLVIFAILSLIKNIPNIAPIFLMIFSFVGFKCIADSKGFVDYFSTRFYDGFTFAKIFTLPFPVWFSMLSILFSFIIASVCIYLPHHKKQEKKIKEIEKVEILNK